MPMLNFSKSFTLPVLAGLEQMRRETRYAGRDLVPVVWLEEAEQIAATFVYPKRQTIRAIRKAGNPKVGDVLFLYTGARTKACRKLGKVVCTAREDIHINEEGIAFGQRLLIEDNRDARDRFARADGFSSWEQMRDWFAATHGLPFTGQLIKW